MLLAELALVKVSQTAEMPPSAVFFQIIPSPQMMASSMTATPMGGGSILRAAASLICSRIQSGPMIKVSPGLS